MVRSSGFKGLVLAAALALLGAVAHGATTYTWDGGGDGSTWTDPLNWTADSGYPNGAGDVANVAFDPTVATTINLGAAITIGALSLDDTGGSGDVKITIAPNGGSLTFNNSGSGATLTSAGATNEISAGITLADNLTVTANKGLTLSGGIGESGSPWSLTKAGTDVLNINAASSYSGGTYINAGTINAGATNALGTSGTIYLGNTSGTSAATLTIVGAANSYTINNDITVRSGSGAAVLTLSGNAFATYTSTFGGTVTLEKAVTLAEVTGYGTSDFSGKITGTGAVTIAGVTNAMTTGGGAVKLSNAGNDFVGNISVSTGLLEFGSSSHLGNAANTLTFADATGVKLDSALDITGMGRTITYNGGFTLYTNGFSPTFANGITLGGTGGFTKRGTGTLTMNQANTYSGITTISAGTLQTNNPASLGSNTTATAVTLSGGTLDLRNDSDTDFDKNVTLTVSSTINVDRDTAGTGNTLSLGDVDLGLDLTLTVSGGNGYKLALGDATWTYARSPTITCNGSLTLASLTGKSGVAGAVKTFTFGGTGDTTVSGAITQGGRAYKLVKSGVGTLTLKGTSDHSDGTTISAGTLAVVNNASALGSGTVSLSGGTLSLLFDGAGNDGIIAGPSNALDVSAASWISVGNAGSNTGNRIDLGNLRINNNVLTVAGNNGYTLKVGNFTNYTTNTPTLDLGTDMALTSWQTDGGTKPIAEPKIKTQNTGNLYVLGASLGTIVTSITTEVAGSGMQVFSGTAASAAATTNWTKSGTGTLRFNELALSGGLAAGTITFSAGTLELRYDGAGNDGTITAFSNTVAPSSGVTFNVDRPDAGTHTGSTIFAGTMPTLALNGTINVTGGHGYRLGLAALNVGASGPGTTLNTTTAGMVITSLTNADGKKLFKDGGATVSVAGATLTGKCNIEFTNGLLDFTGAVGQSAPGASFSIIGTNGTMRLSGANTYSGNTTLSAGASLQLAHDSALAGGGTLVLATGGSVSAYGTGGGTRTTAAPVLLEGILASPATVAGDEKLQFNGALTVNTLSDVVGWLNVSNTALTTFDGRVNAAPNGATKIRGLGINTTASDAYVLISTNGIKNTGDDLGASVNPFTKAGPGTVELGAGTTNTYKGATQVDGGTLLVNGTLDARTAAVTVMDGATLGGGGTVVRPVQVNGTLAPGASIDTFTVGFTGTPCDVIFGGGSKYLVDINGADKDVLAIIGNLDLSSGSDTLEIATGSSLDPGQSPYVIVTYTGSSSGTFDTVTNLPANWSPDYGAAGQVRLVYSAGGLSVTDIAPTSGRMGGHFAAKPALATITGTGFAGGATVKFDTESATNVVVNTATTIFCETPPHAAGAADVIVTVGLESDTLPDAYTYTGWEGDIGARTTLGDEDLAASDLAQLRRFVAGLDFAAAGPEFQRADIAPVGPKGDTILDATDLSQQRRYVAGLDPFTAAGGPTGP